MNLVYYQEYLEYNDNDTVYLEYMDKEYLEYKDKVNLE